MNKLVGNGLKALKKKPITDALGFVMYEGPSVLDGAPIVVIATMKSGNTKTGNMVQVWIIRSDMHPVTASKVGADAAICGSSAHTLRENIKGWTWTRARTLLRVEWCAWAPTVIQPLHLLRSWII